MFNAVVVASSGDDSSSESLKIDQTPKQEVKDKSSDALAEKDLAKRVTSKIDEVKKFIQENP